MFLKIIFSVGFITLTAKRNHFSLMVFLAQPLVAAVLVKMRIFIDL